MTKLKLTVLDFLIGRIRRLEWWLQHLKGTGARPTRTNILYVTPDKLRRKSWEDSSWGDVRLHLRSGVSGLCTLTADYLILAKGLSPKQLKRTLHCGYRRTFNKKPYGQLPVVFIEVPFDRVKELYDQESK